MKVITEKQLSDVTLEILKEKERQAVKSGITFSGISSETLQEELSNRFGSYVVKKEETIKFSKSDINAVASARFFRKTGMTLLIGLALFLVALALIVKTFVVMTPLYYNLYYTFCGIVALVFMWIYSKGQAKIRKELWRQLGRDETVEK